MKLKHTTKDGTVMFIAEMEDDHLKNTILMITNTLRAAKLALGGNVGLSKFNKAMFGIDDVTNEAKAKSLIQSCYDKVCPYVFEAALRGLDISKQLQDVFEREGRIEIGLLPGAQIAIEYTHDLNDFGNPQVWEDDKEDM